MANNCQPSTTTEIAAVYFLNRLIIRAKGTKPTPCHTVHIRRSPLMIFPPQYLVETCDSGAICIDVITPFDVTEVFLAPLTETVKVHTAEGTKTVPVKVVKAAEQSGFRLLESTATPAAPPREAVGYSDTFDFREAFQDAVRHLPPDPNPFPDKLITVRVLETGGLFGGIAGFHKLFVRVSAE